MAKFTAGVDLKIRLPGGFEAIGVAGTTHRIPDSLVEEFTRDQVPLIPGGVTWITQDETSGIPSLPIGQTDVSGLTAALAAKYDKTGGTISGAVTVTGALVAQTSVSTPSIIASAVTATSILARSIGTSVIFADQFSSIQAAHDALPATGGTIIVPAGTYLTSGSNPILSITKSNFRLLGAGIGATIFAFANSTATYLVNGNAAGLSNIAIEGIEFDGRNLHLNVTDVTAIRFANTGTTRITVRDCYIHDMPGANETFAINFGNVVGGVIDGVYVSNCRGSGIGISGSTAITIANCISDGCGWMGFTVSSNNASTSMSREITITNCVARANARHGFNIESTEHASLSGLVAKGNGQYGYTFAASGVAGVPYSRYITGSGIIAIDNSSSSSGAYDGVIFSGNGTSGATNVVLSGLIAYDSRSTKLQGYGAKSAGGSSNNIASGDLRGNLTGEADFANGTRNEYRPSRSIIAQVTLSANVSLNNASVTMVPWNTETVDDDNLHSNSTNPTRFTIPTGGNGRYRVRANPRYANNGTGDRINQIYKNGATVLAEDSGAATTAANNLSRCLEWSGDLVGGDYVELAVYQTSTVALNLLAASWFSIERL